MKSSLLLFSIYFLCWPVQAQNKLVDQRAKLKAAAPESGELVIESVLASVDGVPITLREFGEKLTPKRKVSLSEFAQDPGLGQVLDAIIMERLIEAECASRKIKATPEDVERYIDQIAAQNNMSRSEFEEVLRERNQPIEELQHQARLEVLRARLMGQIAQSAPAVSDQELDEGLGSNDGQAEQEKMRFVLKEIVLLKQDNDLDTEARVEDVRKQLEEGKDFSELAREVSQGATASNGGDLGQVAEDDLSDEIREAVKDLSEGEYTEPLDMSDAVRFFLLAKRLESGERGEDSHKHELRRELENRKLERKFEEFFTVDLPKLHKVDRKV